MSHSKTLVPSQNSSYGAYRLHMKNLVFKKRRLLTRHLIKAVVGKTSQFSKLIGVMSSIILLECTSIAFSFFERQINARLC